METGLYLPGDGLLHRWHPLTKLALMVSAFMLGFAQLLTVWTVPLLAPLLGLVVAGLVALDGAETLRVWARRQALVLAPIYLSLILVNGFFFPGAERILWRLGPFGLTLEGLLFAAGIAGRLFLLTGATLLLLLTTQPADLTLGLTMVGIPREISYLVIAAIQLIPRMQARANAILDAQRARGLRTEGGPLVRLRALLPLAGPLIGGALLETDERALALEARAFRAPGPKTSLRLLEDTRTQQVVRRGMLLGSFAILVWSLMKPKLG